MSYILTAAEYFQELNTQKLNEAKLKAYFASIPVEFWQAVSATNFAILESFQPTNQVHTATEVLDHQLFILEQFHSIPDIIRKDDMLTRLGYDVIELRTNGTYFGKLATINEDGLLGKVWDFVKAMVTDADPFQMTLNIIRLVLDVIGLIPFTWAGLPIDIVANALSGLISLYKQEWLAACLSALMCIDVSKASDIIAVTIKPALPFLEPLFKILMREGKSAIELEKGIAAAKDGIIKLGSTSLMETVTNFFISLYRFVVDILMTVVSLIPKIFDWIGSHIPFIGKDTIPKLMPVFDKLTMKVKGLSTDIDFTVKNFKNENLVGVGDAGNKAQLIKNAGDQAAHDAATAGNLAGAPAARAAAEKKMADDLATKFNTATDVVTKITTELKDSPVYKTLLGKETKGKIPAGWTDSWLKVSTENRLIGQPHVIMQSLEKHIADDPALAAQFVKEFGYKPSGAQFLKLSKSGDVEGVRKMLEFVEKTPEVKAMLNPREYEGLMIFKDNPILMVDGVKSFTAVTDRLLELEKKATPAMRNFISTRAKPMRKLLNLITRMVWERYGSKECILQALAPNLNILDTTKNLATMALPNIGAIHEQAQDADITTVINAFGKTPEELAQLKNTDPEAGDQIQAELNRNVQLKLGHKQKVKGDCSTQSTITQAITGNHIPYKSGSNLGIPSYNYDPNSQATFQKNNTSYQKNILKSLNLDGTIDVQHALEHADPVTIGYFADVYDFQNGTIDVNPEQVASRRDKVFADMVKSGKMTQDQANAAKRELQHSDETGTAPPQVDQIINSTNSNTDQPQQNNEGLFKVKGLSIKK